jgi:hypothetical protein
VLGRAPSLLLHGHLQLPTPPLHVPMVDVVVAAGMAVSVISTKLDLLRQRSLMILRLGHLASIHGPGWSMLGPCHSTFLVPVSSVHTLVRCRSKLTSSAQHLLLRLRSSTRIHRLMSGTTRRYWLPSPRPAFHQMDPRPPSGP